MGKTSGIPGFYNFKDRDERDEYFRVGGGHENELTVGITASCGVGDDWLLTQYAYDYQSTVAPTEPGNWKINPMNGKWITIQSKLFKIYTFFTDDVSPAEDKRDEYFDAHPEELKTGVITYLCSVVETENVIDHVTMYSQISFNQFTWVDVTNNNTYFIKGDRGETGFLNINFLGQWDPVSTYEVNNMVTWWGWVDAQKTVKDMVSYIALRSVPQNTDPFSDVNSSYYWAQTSTTAMADTNLSNLTDEGNNKFSHLRADNVRGAGGIKVVRVGEPNDDNTELIISRSGGSLSMWTDSIDPFNDLYLSVDVPEQNLDAIGEPDMPPALGDSVYSTNETTNNYAGVISKISNVYFKLIQELGMNDSITVLSIDNDFFIHQLGMDNSYIGFLGFEIEPIFDSKEHPKRYFAMLMDTNSTEKSDFLITETDANFVEKDPTQRKYMWKTPDTGTDGFFPAWEVDGCLEWDDEHNLRTYGYYTSMQLVKISDNPIDPIANNFTPIDAVKTYSNVITITTTYIPPTIGNDYVTLDTTQTIVSEKTIDVPGPEGMDTRQMNWKTNAGVIYIGNQDGLVLGGNLIRDTAPGVLPNDVAIVSQLSGGGGGDGQFHLLNVTTTDNMTWHIPAPDGTVGILTYSNVVSPDMYVTGNIVFEQGFYRDNGTYELWWHLTVTADPEVGSETVEIYSTTSGFNSHVQYTDSIEIQPYTYFDLSSKGADVYWYGEIYNGNCLIGYVNEISGRTTSTYAIVRFKTVNYANNFLSQSKKTK